MSQGKCKPPDKRYRRKKKLLPGSLVVLFLGVLFLSLIHIYSGQQGSDRQLPRLHHGRGSLQLLDPRLPGESRKALRKGGEGRC